MYDFLAHVPEAPSMMDSYARLMQIKNAQQQQQLGQLQIQEQQQQNQARAQQLQDQQTVLQAQAQDPKNWLNNLRGKVRPATYVALLKGDAEAREAMAKASKEELAATEAKNGQWMGLITQAQAIPDEQFAQAWPQIIAAAEQLHPGVSQQYHLDPNSPMSKQQLGMLGIGFQTQDQYIKTEQERRAAAVEKRAQTEFDAKLPGVKADTAQKVKVEAGTNAQGVTAAQQMQDARERRGQDITVRGQNLQDARARAGDKEDTKRIPTEELTQINASLPEGSKPYPIGTTYGDLKGQNIVPKSKKEVNVSKLNLSKVEDRKALADNVKANLDEMKGIMERRPDLFGPGAGRMTGLKEWMGTGDPDILKWEQAKNNLIKSNVGMHNMRSKYALESDKLNFDFKHSPSAIQGSMDAMQSSADQFVNEASGGSPSTPQTSNDPFAKFGGKKH